MLPIRTTFSLVTHTTQYLTSLLLLVASLTPVLRLVWSVSDQSNRSLSVWNHSVAFAGHFLYNLSQTLANSMSTWRLPTLTIRLVCSHSINVGNIYLLVSTGRDLCIQCRPPASVPPCCHQHMRSVPPPSPVQTSYWSSGQENSSILQDGHTQMSAIINMVTRSKGIYCLEGQSTQVFEVWLMNSHTY